MKKLIALFVMLLWMIPIITSASPILNNELYVHGNSETIMPENDEGVCFNLLNDYMNTIHSVILTQIPDVDYNSDYIDTIDMTSFCVIKPGNSFGLYSFDPRNNPGSCGLWKDGACSENLFEIPHHDVHKACPIPISATVLLFGSGLLGILGFRRKRKV